MPVEITKLEEQPTEVAPNEPLESGPIASGAMPDTPATEATEETESLSPEMAQVLKHPNALPPITIVIDTEPYKKRQALLDWWLQDDGLLRFEKFEAPELPEPVWIQRLDFEGMSRVGFLAATNKEGMIGFGVKGHLQRLATAMFFVALCADEEGKAPLFADILDAQAAVCSMNLDRVRANILLFNKVLEINPSLLELNPQGGA